VGKTIVKHPLKSLGTTAAAAFTVPDVLSGAAKNVSTYQSRG